MADVVHRTTKEYRRSVNTPDFPTANWIHNPDLSAVVGFDSKYWNITGDTVTLMSQAERDAVDAAEAAAQITEVHNSLTSEVDGTFPIGIDVRALIQLFNKRDNYLVNRIIELQNALLAAKATSGGAQSTRDALPASYLATQTRPLPDAIQDYKDDINAGVVDNG